MAKLPTREERIKKLCDDAGILPSQLLGNPTRTTAPRQEIALRNHAKPTKQVGQILKEIIITRYHVPPCQACHETAAKMDEHGADWCRENVDTLAEEVHQNATKRRWTRLLDFAVRLVYHNQKYKDLILEACDKYDEQLRETRKVCGITWTAGMTVAYREKTTFHDTISSLILAGWSDVYVFAEPNTKVD